MKAKMPSSLEYVKRFSMCNCLTISMPDTYTAHAMTVDFFLKRASPGRKIVVDVADERPDDEARAFKIPRRVDTFLFSPFNEAFHDAYEINGVRYTCVGDELGKVLKPLPARPLPEFGTSLLEMDARVTTMWGDVLKILVLYDSDAADDQIKARLVDHDDAAVEALGWPVLRVLQEITGRYADRANRGLWYHYTDATKVNVLRTVESMESRKNV